MMKLKSAAIFMIAAPRALPASFSKQSVHHLPATALNSLRGTPTAAPANLAHPVATRAELCVSMMRTVLNHVA
jgi:hypothetical protein